MTIEIEKETLFENAVGVREAILKCLARWYGKTDIRVLHLSGDGHAAVAVVVLDREAGKQLQIARVFPVGNSYQISVDLDRPLAGL